MGSSSLAAMTLWCRVLALLAIITFVVSNQNDDTENRALDTSLENSLNLDINHVITKRDAKDPEKNKRSKRKNLRLPAAPGGSDWCCLSQPPPPPPQWVYPRSSWRIPRAPQSAPGSSRAPCRSGCWRERTLRTSPDPPQCRAQYRSSSGCRQGW